MKEVVFILTTSDIIFNGIKNIVDANCNANLIRLHSSESIKNHLSFINCKILIIHDTDMTVSDENLFELISRNQVHRLKVETNKKYGSDNTIGLFDTTDKIASLVTNTITSPTEIKKESGNNELSQREIEVLELLALGHSNKSIADMLNISTHTVISHRKNIGQKTGIKSASGLTVYAILNNLINTKDIDPLDLI